MHTGKRELDLELKKKKHPFFHKNNFLGGRGPGLWQTGNVGSDLKNARGMKALMNAFRVFCTRARGQSIGADCRFISVGVGAEQTTGQGEWKGTRTQTLCDLWRRRNEEHEQMQQTASPDMQMQLQRMRSSEKRLWREGIQFSTEFFYKDTE